MAPSCRGSGGGGRRAKTAPRGGAAAARGAPPHRAAGRVEQHDARLSSVSAPLKPGGGRHRHVQHGGAGPQDAEEGF